MANDGANGASVDPPDVDSEEERADSEPLEGQWLPAADLAKMMGLTVKAVTELGESGHLPRTRAGSHKPWLYRVPVNRLQSPSGTEQALRELAHALKIASYHTRETFRMVHEPAHKLNDQYLTLIAKLFDRCNALEQSHTDNINAREAALSQAHERELATQESLQRGQRWDAVFKTLGESVPPVVAQAFETYMEWKGPKAGHALELLRALRPLLEELELPEEVKEKLRDIWKRNGDDAPSEKKTHDTTAEEVPTDGNA